MISKNECCGCGACKNACPKSNINMATDEEGFLYPQMKDKLLCGDCALCQRVCFYNKDLQSNPPNKVLACKSKVDDIRYNSSSGGVFSILAESVLVKGGVICGAAFDDNCVLIHSFAEGDDYVKFRRSKYVQSDTKDAYTQTKQYLEEGRDVLFTGTPCQIAGLKSFLNKDYEKLLCMDFICHGVPSPKMFRAHLSEISAEVGSDVVDYCFRTKDGVWKKLTTTIASTRDGNVVTTKRDPYMLGFLQNLYLRPSCHSCGANKFRSGADITIGDYWGCETAHRSFDDEKGISIALLHSNKGHVAFDDIKEKVQTIEADLNHAVIFNRNLVSASLPHPKRADFFRKIQSGVSFSVCVKMFTKNCTEIARNLLSPGQVRYIQLFLSKLKGVPTQ